MVNSGQFVECLHDRGFVSGLLMNRKLHHGGLTSKIWAVPTPLCPRQPQGNVRIP